ncbi:MAG: hypothetical protein ACKOKC_05250, partial [Chthoniobacterales bacterium]
MDNIDRFVRALQRLDRLRVSPLRRLAQPFVHLVAPVGECFAVLIEHGQHELAVGIALLGCGKQQLLR